MEVFATVPVTGERYCLPAHRGDTTEEFLEHVAEKIGFEPGSFEVVHRGERMECGQECNLCDIGMAAGEEVKVVVLSHELAAAVLDRIGVRPCPGALHRAVARGKVDLVKCLILAGVDPMAPDPSCPDMNTPLHTAAKHGRLAAFRTLLKLGATNTLNISKKSPQDLATGPFRHEF